jgi:hypothetical protein
VSPPGDDDNVVFFRFLDRDANGPLSVDLGADVARCGDALLD